MLGKCDCLPHRNGIDCSVQLCSKFDTLCASCTLDNCLACQPGYYLTGNRSKVCSTCYDFDPRCVGCTVEQQCTVCADPLLTSIRRSGARASDLDLPIEENTRELSITIPFGSKSPEAFADSENFFVSGSKTPLNDQTKSCIQGGNNDESWNCTRVPSSNKVCGHLGVFKFLYPNYVVSETSGFLSLTVQRSGGGYGSVSIVYFIKHISTNDSDVSPTAPYTTVQRLEFDPGVIERTFKINILDDNIPETNETFQVLLEVPEGGGSIGAQFRTNVTIVDDDLFKLAPSLTYPLATSVSVRAGRIFSVDIQAVIANQATNMTEGGEKFFAVIENNQLMWNNPGTADGSQRHAPRTTCSVSDNNNGQYTVSGTLLPQGNYQLRAYHAFPGGLWGEYYEDAFYVTRTLTRFDRIVNFTWGTGRIMHRGSDYISIRWSGAVMFPVTDDFMFKVDADDNARLWVDGDLILDRFHMLDAFSEPPRTKRLLADTMYEVVLEYREITGEAHVRLIAGARTHSNVVPIGPIPSKYLYTLYEINSSPVMVKVISGSTAAATTECTGAGLYGAVALQRSEFTVCPRDQYGNLRDDDFYFLLSTQMFSASVTLLNDLGFGGDGSEILTPVLVFNNATFCFDAHYTAERAGNYQLEVVYQSSRDDAFFHVAGSPFILNVAPTKTSGPYSEVHGLPSALYLTAGDCHKFTIISRDFSRNLRLQGGDDFQVYMYQIDYFTQEAGLRIPPKIQQSNHPSSQPSSTPSSHPTAILLGDRTFSVSPALETLEPVVRFGLITDLRNGNYTGEICPVIAGWYEVHVLLNGRGVSNQPNRIMDRWNSYTDNSFGGDQYRGQYVAGSPYSLTVAHAAANAFTSSVMGPGLTEATVGVPTDFMLTTRDPWDNVVRTESFACTVTAVLNMSPSVNASIWNYGNGSFFIEYVAKVAGANLLTVKVNGMQIPGSPFRVHVIDGRTSEQFSFAGGQGLHTGTTGVVSYFELFSFDFQGNRKSTTSDTYSFTVSGSNTLSGTMLPCPQPPSVDHPICDPTDTQLGHYYGFFTPHYTGQIVVEIFFDYPDTGAKKKVKNSPFGALISPSAVHAEICTVRGALYDNVAGVDAFITVQLRDNWGNTLWRGGQSVELAQIGVGVEWGTIQPWNATPGLQDAYHYKGFYAGYPSYYGTWVDHADGTLTVRYNIDKAGQYVTRLAVAEPGLNATYFNGTTFGYLTDNNYNMPGFVASRMGVASNFGTTISWTGDIGGRYGLSGELQSGFANNGSEVHLHSSYYNMYKTRTEASINFNTSMSPHFATEIYSNHSETTFLLSRDKYRERYWSARWFGLITPKYAETYIFRVRMDDSSTVRLVVGGVGTMLNGSQPGDVVINTTSSATSFGTYTFTDKKSREFVLEYAHFEESSFLQLLWESASTPLAVVPPSAFTHWRNMSHYNTTIHPAPLCSNCSTAFGAALTRATVAVKKSFVVYARDKFGNLLQRGGDMPTMVAVGQDGVAFRGDVTDYGNSTYLIEYFPTVSGVFRMFVTMGCCAPPPQSGLPSTLEQMDRLLIQGAPFTLTIESAAIDSARSIGVGEGLLGGVTGQNLTFVVLFRDIYNNPTTADASIPYQIEFSDQSSNNRVLPSALSVVIFPGNMTIVYNMTRAGRYNLVVTVADGFNPHSPVIGSPFDVTINPSRVFPPRSTARGVGLHAAAKLQAYSFELTLHDMFNNTINYGGSKVFVRLLGDSTFADGALTNIPRCQDKKNGRYLCTYTAASAGHHELVVKILNTSFDHPGGTGLAVHYYSANDPLDPDSVPVYSGIDRKLSVSWPNGFSLPLEYLSGKKSPAAEVAQSVLWEGFLACPRSDVFQFAAWTTFFDVSIYLDAALVFDSGLGGVVMAVQLMEGAAYRLRVVARLLNAELTNPSPCAITLAWSTPLVALSAVPGFFLYDAAFEIPLSPFPVAVVE